MIMYEVTLTPDKSQFTSDDSRTLFCGVVYNVHLDRTESSGLCSSLS